MRPLLTLYLIFIASCASYSQELIGSTGDHLTSPNGTLSWSIGEISTATFTNSSEYLTQGFHQVDRRFVNIEELLGSEIKVYPSPFESDIIIDFPEINEKMNLYIFSYSGQLVYELRNFNTFSGSLSVDLSSLSRGGYLLEIKSLTSETQFFRRIIKN